MKKWLERPLKVAQRTEKRLKATFKKMSSILILWYNLQSAAMPLVWERWLHFEQSIVKGFSSQKVIGCMGPI